MAHRAGSRLAARFARFTHPCCISYEGSADSPGPLRWILLVAVTLIMLWAGLDPKGYRFRNEVEWIEGRTGVRFGRFGRVETEPFLSREQATALNQDGYALELALDPLPDAQGDLGVLASFHSGVDVSQLVICQWGGHLIAMNGDDYDHSRRLPRVTIDTSKYPDGPLMLTINSTPKGTSLYLNGEVVATNANLHLMLPSEPDRGRLVLGNSVSASHPWRGVVSFFSLLPRPLTAGEVESRWGTRGKPTTGELLLYRFEEASGRTIRNHGSLAAPLVIPSRLHALGRRFLQISMASSTPRHSLMLDTVVNLIGFMPLGVAIAIVLRSHRGSPGRSILVAVFIGFALSLAIELTQAWLPSRNSSLWDLLLNTAGAFLGAWLSLVAGQRLSQFLSRRPIARA